MKKQLLLFALAFASLLPITAQTINNGVLSGCNELTGEYVIPEDVKEIADFAFMTSNVTKVVMGPNVKKIGDCAFAYCTQLTEVVFPENCTLETIGADCFMESGALKTCNFPKSIKKIGGNCFFLCENLSTVTLPEGLDTIPAHMFQSCKALRELALPKSVKVISHNAFAGCTNLDDLTMPSVDSIATKAFIGCEALKEIPLPENLRAIADSAFMRCERIKTLKLPKSLQYVGARISRKCYKLERFVVDSENPHFIAVDGVLYSKDKSILYECPAKYATEVFEVPATVRTLAPGCFFECNSISAVNIPTTIESIGYESLCFNGMKQFNFEGNAKYRIINDGLYAMDDAGKLPVTLLAFPTMGAATTCTVPFGTTLIASYALVGNKTLTALSLPSGLVKIDTCAIMSLESLRTLSVAMNVPPKTADGNFDNIEQPNVRCLIPVGAFQNYMVSSWQYFDLQEDEKIIEGCNTIEGCHQAVCYLPSQHKLRVWKPSTIQIVDARGKRIAEYTTTHDNEEVDLSSLAEGLYVVSGKQMRSYKFIR